MLGYLYDFDFFPIQTIFFSQIKPARFFRGRPEVKTTMTSKPKAPQIV